MSTNPYVLSALDGRMTVTVFPSPPAYVYVTHEGLTEGEIDAVLLELTWHIPAPCCVTVLPQHASWRALGLGSEGEKE